MTQELKNLLIMLGSIVVVLLIIVIFFGSKGPMRKLIGFFIEETDSETVRGGRKTEDSQKYSNEPIVEMAKLIRKTDDRLRVFESDGSMHIVDPYYELEFITRKGKRLKISCSETAYGQIPFNEEGSLTYKRNTLVKFKFYEGIIYNDTEHQNG
ncbi:MAG: hypothetical protein IJB68_08815 [Ruminococcus sp.]|nr:hypothetical protein [Ruminococcus sp.]